MKTPTKKTVASLFVLVVIVGAYLYSYGYFDDHHSHFFFTSGEDMLLVPDTAGNRALAIFYAPISFVVRTPIRFEPKTTSSPRPNKALQRTASSPAPSSTSSPPPLSLGR